MCDEHLGDCLQFGVPSFGVVLPPLIQFAASLKFSALKLTTFDVQHFVDAVD